MFEFYTATILPFFIGGLFWDVGLLVVAVVAFSLATYWESGWLAIFGFLIAGQAIYANFSTMVSFVQNHPYEIIGGIFAYLIVGAIFSIAKWFLYLNSEDMQEYIKAKKTYYDQLKPEARESIGSFYAYLKGEHSVSVSKNKSRITFWIAWWPPVLFWTLFSDLLVKVWNHIYNLLGGIYEKILEKTVAKY